MEELIKELEELRRQFNLKEGELLHKIDNYDDEFIYKATSWVHGGSQRHEFKNSFSAKEFIDYFYGDNGVVELTTSNKKFAEEVAGHEAITKLNLIE
tara:strand:+ start:3691 stop:3981 length:291 start_codon:yes stop_codon:yes gene_type:complete